MRRALTYLLPHLLILGIVASFAFVAIYHGSSTFVLGIVFCIGLGLAIFASKIASWWNQRIKVQRERLAERFKISKDSASNVLYDWGIPFNTWAFRLYGLGISLFAGYRLYSLFSGELDEKTTNDILINIFVTVAVIRWWLNAKETPYRKYILLTGVCWYITVISYIFSMSFKVDIFFLIGFIAYLGLLYFLIKAWRAERKFKKRPFETLIEYEKYPLGGYTRNEYLPPLHMPSPLNNLEFFTFSEGDTVVKSVHEQPDKRYSYYCTNSHNQRVSPDRASTIWFTPINSSDVGFTARFKYSPDADVLEIDKVPYIKSNDKA